jgi:sterol desaturase/sphingolipid hydroxylase (fatty acid hydroxylase superfamily)
MDHGEMNESWHMGEAIHFILHHVLTVTALLILASWLSALIGAIIYYVYQYPSENKSFRNMIKYIFPKELMTHKSTRMDCFFVMLNYFSESFTVAPLAFGSAAVTLLTYKGYSIIFGALTPGDNVPWLSYTMFVAVLVVQDLMVFLSHYLEHKVPILWELHKVHHSLPVMTPLSNRRHHPWQLVFEGGFSNFGAGFILGSVSYIVNVPVLDNALLGTDSYFFASVLSFYQLRHSHIPLRYGRLERWFLSPAQHQLHHSVEDRDWDRNFSLLLSCWDRLAKTIVYSDPNYTFRIGLQPQHARDYDKVWKLFLIPPYNIYKLLFRKTTHPRTPPLAPDSEVAG